MIIPVIWQFFPYNAFVYLEKGIMPTIPSYFISGFTLKTLATCYTLKYLNLYLQQTGICSDVHNTLVGRLFQSNFSSM